MGKSSKKPRTKLTPCAFDSKVKSQKKDKDWSFDEIARSKTHRH